MASIDKCISKQEWFWEWWSVGGHQNQVANRQTIGDVGWLGCGSAESQDIADLGGMVLGQRAGVVLGAVVSWGSSESHQCNVAALRVRML